MVLVAEDVAQHGPLVTLRDKTHGDTGHRLAQFDAGIHQRHAAGADGSHRRRSVGFEDVADHTDGVGALLLGGQDLFEGAPGQVAVTHLAAAGAAGAFDLAGGEAGEVVVQQETAHALDDGTIDLLLVELGAKGAGAEGLGLAAGKDGATVSRRQVVGLAPDGADLVELTAVETGALVEHHVAHGFTLGVVIVAVNHELDFVGEGLLGIVGIDKLLLDGGKAVLTLVLVGNALLAEIVALLVDGVAHTLAQFLVVHLVAVFALLGLAGLHGQLVEHAALDLDGLVGGLEGVEHHVLTDLLHLAFHHHDVVGSGSHDEVEIGAFDVLHGGVDDILAVEVAHAHLADGAVEGDVAHGEGRSGSQSGQLVGHGVVVAGDEVDVHLNLGVEIVGEEGTQGTVDQAGNEDFMLRGTSLTFEETAREATHGGIFFLIVNGKGHEVDVLAHLLLRTDGG